MIMSTFYRIRRGSSPVEKLAHWEQHRHRIGQTMLQMRERADFDASRYCIEYYRSQRELLRMAPVL
jgi:hypothetical protein